MSTVSSNPVPHAALKTHKPAASKGQTRSRASLLPGMRLDRSSGRAVYWQLYDEIKRLILGGVIPAGAAMPSPRLIASEFGCSRHTVSTAYEYLVAEGLLTANHGVGTFVSQIVEAAFGSIQSSLLDPHAARPVRISRFAERLEEGRIDRDEEDPLQTFGIPDSTAFPYAHWSKIYTAVWSAPARELTHASRAQGYDRLRAEICTFVHRMRGIRAVPEQVLITTGTTQSVDLLLRTLLDPGDSVWVEDPGRPKAVTLIKALGMRAVPIPVDHDGLRIDIAEERAPEAKAVLVTPSHQYPTGATLSLERRLRLLAWANRTGGWILEDDYDGELIADGRPILPAYSLGQNDRVVYMGTFSKSISPQLRLGYLICHPDLVMQLVRLRYFVDYFPSMNVQPVLAEFIARGLLDAYIRRMRRAYRERQSLFRRELRFSDTSDFEVFAHAPALFQPLGTPHSDIANYDDVLSQRARDVGIPAFPLSSFYFEAMPLPGIIVGTGRLPLERIPSAVEDLLSASRALRAELGGACKTRCS